MGHILRRTLAFILAICTTLTTFDARLCAETTSNQVVHRATYPVLTEGDNSPAVLTLHEMLADLGYLPVEFHPITKVESYFGPSLDSPAAGTWSWRFHVVPDPLRQLWDPTMYTEMTKAAVMTFEREHDLPIDGFAGPRVFRGLQTAIAVNLRCQHAYTYLLVRQALPQTLTVWQDGRIVYTSTCSTGVKDAATHVGTHVIYLRNRQQKMEGTTPSGAHYRVEGVPYVSFFRKGEAIHGLTRARYGFPQSVGCVELPIENAKRVWELTDYGTLVTVTQ